MAKHTETFDLVDPKKNSVRYKGRKMFEGMNVYVPNRLIPDEGNPPATIEVTVDVPE